MWNMRRELGGKLMFYAHTLWIGGRGEMGGGVIYEIYCLFTFSIL